MVLVVDAQYKKKVGVYNKKLIQLGESLGKSTPKKTVNTVENLSLANF